MKARSILVAALASVALCAPALAQQTGSAAGAKKTTTAPSAVPMQPALAPLVAPRAAEMSAVGIERIVARTGKQRRDIQVYSKYGGPGYFGWPKNVTPVTFEIAVGPGDAVTVRAQGYTEANKARYAAAFDAVIPQAVRQANDIKLTAQRPKP